MANIKSLVIINLALITASPMLVSTAKPSKSTLTRPCVIISSIPHGDNIFTQGLLYYDGALYESIGRYGQSHIRKLNSKTGEIMASFANAPHEFGEGLTLINHELVQLTYREGYALRYNIDDLSPLTPNYYYQGEGWGLSYVPEKNLLARSDGTSIIRFHDTVTFLEKNHIEVLKDGIAVSMINELEYAQGFLYANIYSAKKEHWHILEIDPTTGIVTALIDMSIFGELENINISHIMNGIAYNPLLDVFYITGKNWQNIYTVKW